MSYQPSPQGQPQQPQGPVAQLTAQEEEANKALEQILGGPLPGAGYLYADEPEKRQANLIKTNPEMARAALLRAVEVCAQDALLPFGMVTKAELAKAALAFAQAFLLLDPTVDQSGAPVGAQATAEGAAQEGVAQAQAQAQEGLETHKALMQAHVAAHASGQEWSFPVTQSGHALPPKVKPNPAEEAIAEKNKGKSEELKGARGDRPLPRPRVNG